MIPPKIYKYESFSAQSLLNLKNSSVYFGSPLNFNDPYDCAINATIETPSDKTITNVLKYYCNDSNISALVKKQFQSLSKADLRKQLVDGSNKALVDTREKFLAEHGVTCFSECNDNLLMWSHYGGKYKGICLEFDTKHPPFNRIRKVQYVNNMPKVKMDDVIINKKFDHIKSLFCTKSSSWDYEQEWRAFHKKAGTTFSYDLDALKGVYFGPEMDRQAMEIVCLIINGQNPNISFWEGTRSSTNFKVNFKEFSYISHFDAKRQGAPKESLFT